MDRVQLLLVGLPIFLFCSDLVNLFTPPPAKPAAAHHHHHQQKPSASLLQTPSDPSFIPDPVVDGAGYGTTIEIKFCASCSYRGTAVTMKKMLETSFPGIHVILQNYPPALPKRLLSKLVPVVQFGTIIMITAGDQIFPRLGMAQPAWLLKLRANKFGAIASTWLFGNFAQSFLQSSGAFEVYSNGELVFSKLMEQRFPSEFELRELIGNRLPESQFGKNLGKVWS
ncbi:hypothetical protein LUZ60_011080 [Juncus effusus]|nr:hypothetical protein LUZ60_011080 [Juncus effusus]